MLSLVAVDSEAAIVVEDVVVMENMVLLRNVMAVRDLLVVGDVVVVKDVVVAKDVVVVHPKYLCCSRNRFALFHNHNRYCHSTQARKKHCCQYYRHFLTLVPSTSDMLL